MPGRLGMLMAALAAVAIAAAPPARADNPVDPELLAALSGMTPEVAAVLSEFHPGLGDALAEATTEAGSAATTLNLLLAEPLVGRGMAAILTSVGSALEPTFDYPRPALQAMAATIVPADQWWSFNQIITRESGWRVFAVNPHSGAYGLPQALPAHKMTVEGPDWLFNPHTQLRWAYRYMNERYGSPNAAWAFWQAHHWY
ncbi:aggregation-promoting factor C-terminal-like domain-containing protein [Nocardia sp. IFM 10818]